VTDSFTDCPRLARRLSRAAGRPPWARFATDRGGDGGLHVFVDYSLLPFVIAASRHISMRLGVVTCLGLPRTVKLFVSAFGIIGVLVIREPRLHVSS
jgi:hypothetical protein